ncbi:MAG: hypothetical protein RL681_116 [Candidatus Parcubacteria bacterium]
MTRTRQRTKKIYELSAAKASICIKKKRVSVGVVGFGYIGSVIGTVLASRGFRTIGVDTNKELVASINSGNPIIHEPGLQALIRASRNSGMLTATTDYGVLKDVDIIIVTVGTPLGKRYAADLSHITAAAKSVASQLRRGHLIIMKSTMLPGTTEGLARDILERSGLRAGRDFGLAASPERLSEGTAIAEFTSLPIVVGGYDQKSSVLVARFWELALGVRTIIVADPKAAEMSKLADNVWIDLNISLANELAKLCDALNIDTLDVIRAANTLPKTGSHISMPGAHVNILMPSMGVGGYCLTKDPWFVRHLGLRHGLNLRIPATSRRINDGMPAYMFSVIERSLESQGKKLKTSNVAVLGLAFKSNTGDCRFTPTKRAIELLEKSGCALSIYDPLVSTADAKTVTNIPLSRSLEAAVRGADCIAFFTGHHVFKTFSLKKLRNLANKTCSIVDGRNMFQKDDIQKIKKVGFLYRGIGRT